MEDKTILLVEDNADDEALTRRALKQNNITSGLSVARNGVEALEFLFGEGQHSDRAQMDMPDVVLLDLQLPKIGGLEVLRRLRADERTRLLSVVVLTSSNEVGDIETSYRLGANSYIRKPVDFNQFTKAIGELSHYWLELNVAPPLAEER